MPAKFNWDGFLDKLAAYMAANATGGGLPYSATPRAVWRHQAVERDSTFVAGSTTDRIWSVLRYYAGSLGKVPVAEPAIQVETVTRVRANAFARAQALFDALTDASGRPVRMLDLGSSPSFRVLAVTLRPIQEVTGIDERARVVFNFDVKAVPI